MPGFRHYRSERGSVPIVCWIDISAMGGKLKWQRTVRYFPILFAYFFCCSCDIVLCGIGTEISPSAMSGSETTRYSELSENGMEESSTQISFETTSEVETNSQEELRATNVNRDFSLLEIFHQTKLRSNYPPEKTRHLHQEPRELATIEQLDENSFAS